MAVNQKTIFVYDDFSTEQPVLMGSLYVNVIKGGESYSLLFDLLQFHASVLQGVLFR